MWDIFSSKPVPPADKADQPEEPGAPPESIKNVAKVIVRQALRERDPAASRQELERRHNLGGE